MFKAKEMMLFILVMGLMALSCSGPEPDQPVLTAKLPLHLEEHVDVARIEGSVVPKDVPAPVEWRFDKPQPDWKVVGPIFSEEGAARLETTVDALRIHFSEEANRTKHSKNIIGAVYTDLPEWKRDNWGEILVRAKNSDRFLHVSVCYNLGERKQPDTNYRSGVLHVGDISPIISDGDLHTYKLDIDVHNEDWGEWRDPWRQLVLYFVAPEPASLDLLSVTAVPKEYIYADAPTGVKTVERSQLNGRTLYTHTPGRLVYNVQIPQGGRLDFGIGVIKEDSPVTFRIIASQRDEETTLFEETYSDRKEWAHHSVDLSSFAEERVKLALETDANSDGEVALWMAPTLTGLRSTKKPNVIFYIIDGASPDHMSVYGYNRRTTPNLERIAAEGAIFENAYSNSSWTKVSNPSFMTSLHHSVLGGLKSRFDLLPDQAVTMAQHMHRARYQTAVFTINGWAGMLTGFDRGVDAMHDISMDNYTVSSKKHHEDFWNWRSSYPGEPYWVHFQTLDVHRPWRPKAPFGGLFVAPEQQKVFYEWWAKLRAANNSNRLPYSNAWEKTGISKIEFSNIARGLYDEGMAHNDYQIGQLVKRLKAAGEWENTLLIIAADHGSAGVGLMQLDPLPPKWGGPIFASYCGRIPMIFIWPERIAPGQRFSEPVSMIDMLPTILDLAELPMPKVMQGQSLAPLLLGEKGWELRPVIFDEFYVDTDTGELSGNIEVADGRWGASLEINPDPEDPPERQRPESMLLFDIWNDPYCFVPLNDKYPDLVEKYTKFLEERWEIHQAMAKHFKRSKESLLTSEQLEILRALGYIR